jgi:hypothetical protein
MPNPKRLGPWSAAMAVALCGLMVWPTARTPAQTVPAQGEAAPAASEAVPHFEVDPYWPKPLPNNWILGQVAGVAVDSRDHIWIVHRPRSLQERQVLAARDPPPASCCVAAPPVLAFDMSGSLLRAWGGPGEGYQCKRSFEALRTRA